MNKLFLPMFWFMCLVAVTFGICSFVYLPAAKVTQWPLFPFWDVLLEEHGPIRWAGSVMGLASAVGLLTLFPWGRQRLSPMIVGSLMLMVYFPFGTIVGMWGFMEAAIAERPGDIGHAPARPDAEK